MVKGQLVADVLNSQHAGIGATWRINTKILSACRGRRHIVAAARLQLIQAAPYLDAWRQLGASNCSCFTVFIYTVLLFFFSALPLLVRRQSRRSIYN